MTTECFLTNKQTKQQQQQRGTFLTSLKSETETMTSRNLFQKISTVLKFMAYHSGYQVIPMSGFPLW